VAEVSTGGAGASSVLATLAIVFASLALVLAKQLNVLNLEMTWLGVWVALLSGSVACCC